MASIYLRNETWWITYRIGGRNIAHTLGTKNARVAAEMKQQYEALKTSGHLPKPSTTRLGPVLQDLCEYWRRARPGKSAETDIGRLRGVFGPCCEALQMRTHTPHRFRQQADILSNTGGYLLARKLEDVTGDAIRSYLQHRFMSGEIGGKTANKIRAVLSSLFAYAKEHHGYVCPDPDLKTPIDAVKRFTEEHPPIVWLKSDDIAKQLEALTEYPEIRAMVATCIYAGLRRSEVLWLTKEDVDFEKRLIRVQAKHVDDDAWKPKTRKNRTVPINSKLMEELKNYTATPREGKWFFPASNGGRWDADYFSEFLRELVTVHAPSATRIGAGWPARCAATASRR